MRKYYEMTFTPCVKVEMKNFNKKNDYEKNQKKVFIPSIKIYAHSWEVFDRSRNYWTFFFFLFTLFTGRQA